MGSQPVFFHQMTPGFSMTPGDPNTQYAVPSDRDNRLLWCERAYEEALLENQQSEELQATSRYVDYLMGKQWPKERPTYKSKPVNNRVWGIFWEMVALLTDLRPTFDTKALLTEGDVGTFCERAASGITQATHAWWMESGADLDMTQIVIYAILSTAFSKLEWNHKLRNGWGDFDLIPLSPNQCLPLKVQGYDLATAEAIIYRTPKPLNFFRQKFPQLNWGATGTGFDVQPDTELSSYAMPGRVPNHLTPYQFAALAPGMQRSLQNRAGIAPQMQQSAFPQAWYKEFWIHDEAINDTGLPIVMGDPKSNWSYQVQPGEKVYPRGRLLVQGGRTLLYDGPNPYWHGQHPFSCLRMNIVPWQFHGVSDMRSLVDLQDALNNILAGVMDMVKRALNPGFVAPKTSFSESQWQAMDWSQPGYKGAYSMAAGTTPQFAPTPQLPAFVQTMYTLLDRAMDSTSGLATIQEIIRKRQVPSAETIEQARQTQQTPIRLKGRNIEQYLRVHGTQNISNMLQFYTQNRRLFVPYGNQFQAFQWEPGSYVPQGMKHQEMIANLLFTIPPGSLLGVNKMEQSALYMNLRKMKDISRETIYKELELPIDAQAEEANLEKEMMMQAKVAMAVKMMAAGAAPGGAEGASAGGGVQ